MKTVVTVHSRTIDPDDLAIKRDFVDPAKASTGQTMLVARLLPENDKNCVSVIETRGEWVAATYSILFL